jgi:hypothetical protein
VKIKLVKLDDVIYNEIEVGELREKKKKNPMA